MSRATARVRAGRKVAAAGLGGPRLAPPIVHEVLRSPGRPLDPAARAAAEPRFGHDFSRVRVHTDARAAESARRVGARAYAVGPHVVFGAGQYVPTTEPGRSLLAHELAHVIQQGAARPAAGEALAVGDPGAPAEREADQVARAVASGDRPAAARLSPDRPTVRRSCGPDQIGAPAGCFGLNGDAAGSTFLFRVGCDEFRKPPELPTDEEARLGGLASTLAAGETVKVHGFASEEGDPAFNENLSCARAVAAAAVLEGAASVTFSAQLFKHGATAGNRDDRRSAVIERAPAPAQQPEVPPQPEQPSGPPPAADDAVPSVPACARSPNCPADFCSPFPTRSQAVADRAANAASVLASVSSLNGRAVPLFRKFIFGGGPAGDISATFATDFTNESVTREATRALVKVLQDAVNASPPSFPPGNNTVTLPISDIVDQNTIDALLVKDLAYGDPFSVPGLIAGGVGKGQASCLVGADTTGAQDDARTATGTAIVTKNPDGTLFLDPNLTFTVVDTLDFCPGNCGGSFARSLTVPLSRWEASGISGDVPFTVRFPAPSIVGSAGSEE